MVRRPPRFTRPYTLFPYTPVFRSAGIVVRNALFKLPARVDYRALPRVTFTDPEIAHVGLTETEARERHGDKVRALTWAFAENDRAQAERATAGLVKVVGGARGRVFRSEERRVGTGCVRK